MALQILTMTTSIMFNTPLKEDWNGRFKAMWAKMWGTILFIFKYLQVSFHYRRTYQSFGIFTTRVSDAHCCSLEERIRNPCRHERSISFLKIKWGGGSLIQIFLTIRQATTTKKSKKEKKDKFANHGVGQKTYYNFDFNVNFLFFISWKKLGEGQLHDN